MTTKTSENTQIALIQLTQVQMGKDITNIAADIKDIKANRYVTQNEVQVAISGAIKEINDKITELSNSSSLWRWLSPSLAAILGSLMTFLIISYLKGGRI